MFTALYRDVLHCVWFYLAMDWTWLPGAVLGSTVFSWTGSYFTKLDRTGRGLHSVRVLQYSVSHLSVLGTVVCSAGILHPGNVI